MWFNGKNYKRAKYLKELTLGQRVWFTYLRPQPKQKHQYLIGQEIRVYDRETNKTWGYYKVEFTNENNVGGIVVQVGDTEKN